MPYPFHFFLVPKDEPASLVLITQTDVRRIDPNNGTTLAIVNALDISAIEIWHRNRSLCTAEASVWTTTELKCYRIDDMNVTWALPLPELITSTHGKYHPIIIIIIRS